MAASRENKISAEKLVKIYRGRRVVNEASLDMRPGEIVGLLGPNGAGKSTTFYMITGLVSPNRGRIYLDGRDVTRKAMYRRARLGIGYLPQEPSIFRKLTVAENLLLILEARGVPRQDRKKVVDDLLRKLNIERLRSQKGYVLSGGERRRAEIARALATKPTYLLLDEPFTGIDPISVQELQDLLRDLVKNPSNDSELGILITDHNVRETLEITDRSYIMYDGNILISGKSDEILADPSARKHYLGERFRM
jgi:lipopolysaccharide export system ATP-binding protein